MVCIICGTSYPYYQALPSFLPRQIRVFLAFRVAKCKLITIFTISGPTATRARSFTFSDALLHCLLRHERGAARTTWCSNSTFSAIRSSACAYGIFIRCSRVVTEPEKGTMYKMVYFLFRWNKRIHAYFCVARVLREVSRAASFAYSFGEVAICERGNELPN